MASISMSSSSSAWKGKITWSYTQSITNNTSTVYASISTWKTDSQPSSPTSGAHFTGTLYVGDESVDFSFAQQNVASESDPQWQAELKVAVPHNSDGTGSVYIYCQIDAPYGVSMYNKPLKGGGTYSLTTIPRASSISGVKNVDIGSACSVTWVPLSTSFYYKLKFSMGSWSYTTSGFCPGQTTSYTYDDYTIPWDAAEAIPNTVSGTMSVSLYSYNSSTCSTQIGSTSTASFTVTLPDSVVPTIDSCTVSLNNDANSTVASWGIALAGYTKVNIKATASGAYGSSISSFNISGSYSAILTGDSLDYTGSIIKTSGNKQFNITCTDSRGRTSVVKQSDIISFTAYTKPKVKKLSMTQNSSGKMVATATWEYNSVNGKNSAAATMYYKTSTADAWTLHSGNPTNGAAFTLTALTPLDTLSYNFKIVVTDALGNKAEKEAFSSTTRVLMDFQAGGKGLGIGKICEIDNDTNDTSSLEVSMDSYFWGNVALQNSALLVISPGMFGEDAPEDVFAEPPTGLIYFKKV